MIFKQIDEIISGAKTQTRRVCKDGEYEWVIPLENDPVFMYQDGPQVFFPATETREISAVFTAKRRLKWQVGRDYAVQPGRGKPGVWWKPGAGWTLPDEWLVNASGIPFKPNNMGGTVEGWRPLRITLLSIQREPLQAITDIEAEYEGIRDTVQVGVAYGEVYEVGGSPRQEYSWLWDEINDRNGIRWDDNPAVWRLEFEVKREVQSGTLPPSE